MTDQQTLDRVSEMLNDSCNPAMLDAWDAVKAELELKLGPALNEHKPITLNMEHAIAHVNYSDTKCCGIFSRCWRLFITISDT